MKSNLQGFLLAALMIAIAVGGTAHYLATVGHEPDEPPAPDASLSAGVGLLERDVEASGRKRDCEAGSGTDEVTPVRCESAKAKRNPPSEAPLSTP